MTTELPTGNTKQEGNTDIGNPADRKEQFEVVSSNLEQFMTEQDDPRWRLSVLKEHEQDCRRERPNFRQENKEYFDALENGNIRGYIANQIQGIQEYYENYCRQYGRNFPPTAKFLIDSIPNMQDSAALENVAFILSNSRALYHEFILIPSEVRVRLLEHFRYLYPESKYELANTPTTIDNPSVYAFSNSEAALKEASEFYKSMTYGRRSGRGVAVRWLEDWWKSSEVWWNLKPDNLGELGQLLQSQTVVMDLSDPSFEWEGHRRMLEFCRSSGISSILTEKSPNIIYAHHFVKDVSR